MPPLGCGKLLFMSLLILRFPRAVSTKDAEPSSRSRSAAEKGSIFPSEGRATAPANLGSHNAPKTLYSWQSMAIWRNFTTILNSSHMGASLGAADAHVQVSASPIQELAPLSRLRPCHPLSLTSLSARCQASSSLRRLHAGRSSRRTRAPRSPPAGLNRTRSVQRRATSTASPDGSSRTPAAGKRGTLGHSAFFRNGPSSPASVR